MTFKQGEKVQVKGVLADPDVEGHYFTGYSGTVKHNLQVDLGVNQITVVLDRESIWAMRQWLRKNRALLKEQNIPPKAFVDKEITFFAEQLERI